MCRHRRTTTDSRSNNKQVAVWTVTKTTKIGPSLPAAVAINPLRKLGPKKKVVIAHRRQKWLLHSNNREISQCQRHQPAVLLLRMLATSFKISNTTQGCFEFWWKRTFFKGLFEYKNELKFYAHKITRKVNALTLHHQKTRAF
jgi:hypothetical protein